MLQTDLLKYQDNFKKIKKIAANRYLIVNSTSFDYLLLSNIPFHPFDFSAFKKVYITDGYVIPFLPYYKRYLESECKCNIYAFPSFWKYVRTIRKEAVFVSDPNRVKVVKDYLKEMYGYSLALKEDSVHLIKLRKSDYRDYPDGLKIFQFEK